LLNVLMYDCISFGQKAALVLNASRRFRYTLDLKKREDKEQLRRKIRLHALVIRVQFLVHIGSGFFNLNLSHLIGLISQAALLFKDAGVRGPPGAPGGAALPTGGFGIGEEQLTTMMRDHNFSAIEEAGGVGNQIGYFVFLWESWQDLTLVILMIAAVLSLVLGIKTEVPADGILITGHSLAIDESSMTGESKIVRFAMLFISLHGSLVHKDQKAPILMSGCKVADGYGNMLVGVTAVGINTEWGLLMSSISEDTGEETPLQV
ncbi:hypothetical protein BHM03_00058321, partial [Ensete ventricosum]